MWRNVVVLCIATSHNSSPSPAVTIGFNQSSYTVTEGAGSVSVMVDVQGSLARDVVVTLSTVDGTAMGRCAITC